MRIMNDILGSKISLFYWVSKKHGDNKQNYGDLLSKFIVEQISGRKVKWVNPQKKSFFGRNKRNYLAIGSIINHANESSVVWGSGIIDFEQKVAEADFRAVRGPQTRKFLIEKGYKCPEVYGDPGLLLPKFFSPKVEKKYKLGIIPHFVDLPLVEKMFKGSEDIAIINLITDNIELTTIEILECENIISSSLHGIIVSHSYHIPAVWVKFSNNLFGNNIKYKDYFESVALEPYEGEMIEGKVEKQELLNYLKSKPNLPNPIVLSKIQNGLVTSCPFRKDSFLELNN